MFKKKPTIKNLSPLRSSDRRKLADRIIAEYQVTVPTAPPAAQLDDAPGAQPRQDHGPQPLERGGAKRDDASAASAGAGDGPVTLASIRNRLLPEATSSARFTTTAGPAATPVSGIVYVGAHPEQQVRVLWIQYAEDPRLVPTVYTLWQNPGLVPLLHTPDFVAHEKLRQGADLMTPGLVQARAAQWDPRATKGSVVAVAGMARDTVPLWVGTCEIDVSQLASDYKSHKGVAVRGLHWEGDEIWNWSSVAGAGGKASPAAVDGWPGLGLSGGVEQGISHLALDDAQGEQDGAKLDDQAEAGLPPDAGEQDEEEEEQLPTPAEVDQAFYEAFLFALFKAKQKGHPPHYGFDFPIQPSFLIANMVQPHLRRHSQHYHIKKTSWKNAKKFIKHLEKAHLLRSKDRNGGETVILDLAFDNRQIDAFVPYQLPLPKAANESTLGPPTTDASPSSMDPSKGQKLTIRTCYRAGPKLVPTLLSSKTDFYSAQQVISSLKSYIDQRPELGGQSSASIKLDAFLANSILGTNPAHEAEDKRAIAQGRITRGALQKRVLEDSRLCPPYFVIERGGTADAAEQKPRPGQPPKVNIVIEKRTGSKVVTRLSNLEPFFINPHLLAPELQKKCAGSCSVSQLPSGKIGMLEVVIQGDQVKVLTGDVLPKRGVDAKWVDVVDKTKSKKK